MPHSLYREMYPPAFRALRLASRTELTPDFLRLRLRADEPDALAGFRAPGAGDHGRVFVGRAEDEWAVPVDADGVPAGEFRVETIVDYSEDDQWVDLDVLVHRDADGQPAGVIGRWAADAPLGAPAVLSDPKGSVLISGTPDAWVLAGDDSAIPAVRRYLRLLADRAPEAPGVVLLETAREPAALGLDFPDGVEVRILSPRAEPTAALAATLAGLDRPSPAPTEGVEGADVFVFACAEQSIVAPARAVLGRWGIEVEHAVVKGYWKRG